MTSTREQRNIDEQCKAHGFPPFTIQELRVMIYHYGEGMNLNDTMAALGLEGKDSYSGIYNRAATVRMKLALATNDALRDWCVEHLDDLYAIFDWEDQPLFEEVTDPAVLAKAAAIMEREAAKGRHPASGGAGAGPGGAAAPSEGPVADAGGL
jgi:hypothetical protein